MILRDYQEKAVRNLTIKFSDLITTPEDEVCILKAPTGSGKTIICAEFLKRFVKDAKDLGKFSFIWISVRRLHNQSKDKLEKYYDRDQSLTCSNFEDLIDRKIEENEILFINWDSINKKNISIFVRENEQDNNLNAILQNTKDEGRKIILIIDESHHTAGSERSKELINIISPKITLEVSATPKLQNEASELVRVSLSNVKEEEMIKSEIAVNPEFSKIKIGSKSATDLVIEQALKKRQKLKTFFKTNNSNVNPLVLIQLPDKKEKQEKKKDEVLKILQEKNKITEENGKLAIWLSEKKSTTLPNIEKNDNEVEVLLFKQAIALGWDCPRASILVIFRESTNLIFTIQVIGRIMRMPEHKYYYNSPELNRSFIFTNLASIEIAEDYAKDYVAVYESKRREKLYNKLHLKSVYLKRHRERTRLSGKFVKIFEKTAKKRKLKEKIFIPTSRIETKVLSDGIISNADQIGKIKHKGTRKITISETTLQIQFDDYVRERCSPFAPRDSGDRMKTALYQFFKDNFNLDKYDPKIQQIILDSKNTQVITDAINLAKEEYKATIDRLSEKRERISDNDWEVPLLVSYNSGYKAKNHEKSILDPFYVLKLSKPEALFIDSLNKSDKVNWWFKNGTYEIKYFGVPYADKSGVEKTFYVDFIVSFTDGTIGLFDTKKDRTAEDDDAGPRSNGLQKYIVSETKKGKKLWGGILINVDGTWRYTDKKKYSYDPNNLSDWKVLDFMRKPA